MNITITQSHKKQDIIYVLFECACGQGKGVWRAEKAEMGSKNYVEFDIEELRSATKAPTADKSYMIEFADGVTSITGDIITVQHDVVLFRFADIIVQIDYCFESAEIGEWVTISVAAHNLLIYPLNL